MRALIPALLYGLMSAVPALAVEPGQMGHASFFCADAEAMEGFGLLLEGGADDDLMTEAVAQELEEGVCQFFPTGSDFKVAENLGQLHMQDHELWKVTYPHGNTVYLLHKLEGKPS
jgi:hypothetical protein